MTTKTSLLADLKELEGKTRGDKHHVINQISKKLNNHEYDSSEINTFLEIVDKSDYFHKVIYILLVQSTKNTKHVMNSLLSEDDFLIYKAINQCDFFWANQEFALEYYINSVFPKISYSFRMRLLENLAKNMKTEAKAEEAFNYLKKNYSLSASRPFLKYCSLEFIVNQLKGGKPLKFNELYKIKLIKPKIVLDYIRATYEMKMKREKFSTLIKIERFEILFKNLFPHYVSEIVQLTNEFLNHLTVSFPKLGRNTTKLVLEKCKTFILQEPKFYIRYLDYETICKYLSPNDYEIIYKGLFPEKIENFTVSNDILKYLDYYKNKSDKLNLLLDTYKKVYNEDLLKRSKNLVPDILKLMSVEQRVKYTQEMINMSKDRCEAKYGIDLNPDELTSYLSCELALPRFKDQIHICPDSNKRSTYLELMIKCCAINEDMTSFLEFLKYCNRRHRNEIFDVRYRILRTIDWNISYKMLNADHWEQIHEMFNILDLNGEFPSYGNGKKIIYNYIKYNWKNKKSIEEPLTLWIKYIKSMMNSVSEVFKGSDDFVKHCFYESERIISKLSLFHKWFGFVEFLSKWNKNHVNDIISITNYEWICQQIHKTLREKQFTYSYKYLREYIKYDKKASDIFLKDLMELDECSVYNLSFLIKANPDAIRRNIKNISDSAILKGYLFPILKKNRLESLPDVEMTLKKSCEQIVHSCLNRSDDSKRLLLPGRLHLLTHWMSGDEFFELIKAYIPEQGVLQDGTKNANLTYDIQKAIASSLKYYKGHEKTFNILRKFCVGDYLKFSIGSLYSICLKSPYYKTKNFLDTCLETPVSFQKHIIRLQFLICTHDFVIEFCKNLWQNGKNASIRGILLSNIFNAFINDPNEESWIVFKTCVENLTENDKNYFKSIIKTEKVSDDYMAQYLELLWKLFRKYCNDSYEFKDLKSELLTGIHSVLIQFKKTFIFDILENNLFKNVKDLSDNENHFNRLAVYFIIVSPTLSDQAERINFALKKMKAILKQEDIDGINKTSWNAKMFINNFLETFCYIAVDDRNTYENGRTALNNFNAKIKEIMDLSTFSYRSYLKIKFANAFILSNNECKIFGGNLRQIIHDEVATHETYIIPYFSKVLDSFINDITELVAVHEVVNGILHSNSIENQSISCILTAINLVDVADMCHNNEYKEIFEFLQTVNDKRVQIYLNKPDAVDYKF